MNDRVVRGYQSLSVKIRNHSLLLLLVLSTFLPRYAYAQETKPSVDFPLYRTYTSQDYERELQLVDTSVMLTSRTMALQEVAMESELVGAADDWQEFTIPLVFHVLYVNEADRVTEQQILEQIEILNEDFMAASLPKEDPRDPDGDFLKLAADTKIQFCRASATPSGLPTTAVEYRQTGVVSFATALALELKQSAFGAAPWDPQRYLNIWIVPQEVNVAGYAQRPGAKGATDGIVIDPKFFGVGGTAVAPFDGGKTLTHLIGTYLGLSELWSEGGCGDDGVDDTPVHNGPNFGTPGRGHVSTCDGYPLEMTMNFMDNTDDAAQYMFTRGQAERMRSVLLPGGLRAGLVQTATQCASDFPVVPLMLTAAARPADNAFGATEQIATLTLSPNPADDRTTLNIQFPQGVTEGQLAVYDARGSKVYASSLVCPAGSSLSQHDLDVAEWVAGTYLVGVRMNGHQLTQPLVVR